MDDRQDATRFTRAVNDELLSLLPFEDRQDFEDAARGHIADISGSVVRAAVVDDPDITRFYPTVQAAVDSVQPLAPGGWGTDNSMLAQHYPSADRPRTSLLQRGDRAKRALVKSEDAPS